MSKKILFIVEGKRDGLYAKRLAEEMRLEAQVIPVQANIYMLFSMMKKDDFQINITDALMEMKGVSGQDKDMLLEQEPFTYTYLLFDMDPHDNSRSFEVNTMIIKEMLSYFIDETDNTVGKLYISYPMLEALWDYDKHDPEEYRNRTVSVDVVKEKNYKELVGHRGYPRNVSKYTIETFKHLGMINVKKTNLIVASKWNKPEYSDYIKYLDQQAIIDAEEEMIASEDTISVLSGLPLFMVDYWGNTNGFYDSLFE